MGLEEGLVPHSRSLGSTESLEEERRLCYAIVTALVVTFFFVKTYRVPIVGVVGKVIVKAAAVASPIILLFAVAAVNVVTEDNVVDVLMYCAVCVKPPVAVVNCVTVSPPLNVFVVPELPNDCAPVVTTPRAVPLASGTFIVAVPPSAAVAADQLTSVPAVPVAKFVKLFVNWAFVTVPLNAVVGIVAEDVNAPPTPAEDTKPAAMLFVIANVPDVVIGEPATDKPVGTVAATEVTVPPPIAVPIWAIVTVPTVPELLTCTVDDVGNDGKFWAFIAKLNAAKRAIKIFFIF